MRMKPCIRGIIAILGMIFLTACGQEEAISTNSSVQEKNEWSYEDLVEGFVRVGEAYQSLGDWNFTKGNDKTYSKKINPDLSIFTIYVNPLATDEVMEDYVNLALAMDKVYDQNANYKKYCKKNKPYFVEFDCHNEIIASMKLNGTHDEAEIRAMLVDGTKEIRVEVSKQLDAFHKYLENNDKINRDDAGNYYFILDSENISESLVAVEDCVREINAQDPIGADEYSHYIGSMRKMGYLDGSYVIYLDSYGGECIQIGLGEYRNPNIEFAVEAKHLFIFAYYYLVGVGEYTDIADGFRFYHLIHFPEQDPLMLVNIEAVSGETNEDIVEGIYLAYEYFFEKMEQHGIKPWCDFTFEGMYDDPEDANFMYDVQVAIPMDGHLEKEAFEKLYMEGCNRYPQGYFDED